MNKLYLELNNYKNHLSPQSRIYFAAGHQVNLREYQIISNLLNFKWITADTQVTEIIQYFNNSYKLELPNAKVTNVNQYYSSFDRIKLGEQILPRFKKWLTIQRLKIIFSMAVGKMLLKNPDFSVENLTPEKIATSFYLGVILSQQPPDRPSAIDIKTV